MAMECADDDDMPQLSAHALSALQEFYSEQTLRREQETLVNGPVASTTGQALVTDPAASATGEHESCCSMPQEDWGLSQFWYDDETAYKLAQEALHAAGETGSIACVSAPTAYAKIRQLKQSQRHSTKVILLEYDKRFSKFGADFVFYDYNDPLNLDGEFREQFDVVLVDPPFLAEECLCKTALTVKFLTKHKIILCTGFVMVDLADRLLHVKACDFIPAHENQLGNEFRCYTNFDPVYLKNNS